MPTRRAFAPQGAQGGRPGSAGAQRLLGPHGEVKELDGCFSLAVQAGWAIEIETPGGGGFGEHQAETPDLARTPDEDR